MTCLMVLKVFKEHKKMKNSAFIFFRNVLLGITFVLNFGGCKKSADSYSGPLNSFKRYPYKNFHVSYDISGDGRGTEEIYVSDYGRYEAQFSKTDIFAENRITSEDHTLLTRISDIYTLDNQNKTYLHNHLNALDSIFHLDASDIPTSHQYMEASMKSTLMKNTGTDTVDGKLASRWQLTDGFLTIWMWNDILLRKTAGSKDGSITMNIKSMDSLWTVDTTKFMMPKGYIEASKPNN
jgi:hypothetical protein